MTTQTGTFSGSDGLADFLQIVHDFAVDEGWTVTAFSGLNLNMNNGDACFANIQGYTSDTVNDTYGSTASATSPDHRLYIRLGTNSTSLTPRGNNGTVAVNDLQGPYSKYWLFSGGPSDPKYIYAVLQKSNGRFCVFGIGNLDKKGVTYTGGGFAFGMWWGWYFQNSSNTPGFWSNEGSDPSSTRHVTPFEHDSGSQDICSYAINVGEFSEGTQIIAGYGSNSYSRLSGLYDRSTDVGQSEGASRWLGSFFFVGPNPINGVTPLIEAPILWENNSTGRNRCLGALPNFRFCSMLGRKEAEEVSFASDNYMVFPFKKALPWNPEPWSTKVVTSGPYGYAIKEVG